MERLTRPSTALMEIRQFNLQDIPAMLDIQRRSPQAAQWREADYTGLAADPNALLLVAVCDAGNGVNTLAGLALWRRVADEAELRNLAVDSACRRRGIASALLAESHRRLADSGVTHTYLEVRPSNRAAMALYHALGYERLSLRRNYYSDPPEDALVLGARLARP